MNNRADSEIILFYNTENFFSPDSPQKYIVDAKSSGLQGWDERKYIHKLNRIARVFQLLENKEDTLPMIIGLAEVQGEKVLEDLVKLPPFSSKYKYLHYESLDERGVDVALIYDSSKIEILHSEPISYLFETATENSSYIDTTRDILFCKVKSEEKIINVFVCHLPSKREKDINRPKRNFILRDIKIKIEKLEIDKESIILMGDFNDNPDEENMQDLTLDASNNKILINKFQELFKEKNYSTYHINEGLLFDQILLSKDFFSDGKSLSFQNANIFDAEELITSQEKDKGKPFRTYAGRRYLGGYSDHFPVYINLKKHKTQNTKDENFKKNGHSAG